MPQSPRSTLVKERLRASAKLPRQLPLLKRARTDHGGSLRLGKRKERRPLAAKTPIHVVLRSSRARGIWSMLRHADLVDRTVRGVARRFGVQVMEFSNVGNHLHLLVRGQTQEGVRHFLRTVTALLARRITGAKKGNPQGKFWDALAYTRLVTWGRELSRLKNYFIQNDWDATGMGQAWGREWLKKVFARLESPG